MITPPNLSTCCTCGHTWKTGTHGGHSCAEVLAKQLHDSHAQIVALREALEQVKAASVELQERIKNAMSGKLHQAERIDAMCAKALSSPPPPVVSKEEFDSACKNSEEFNRKWIEAQENLDAANGDAEILARLLKLWRADLEESATGGGRIEDLDLNLALARHSFRTGK